MISSWQVAQLHAQQGQAFQSQQAFSQQISSRMPQPYQGVGLGATGMGGGAFGPQGYNYGASQGGGYGPGNSFGNSATSMIGGGIHAVGGGMGIGGAIAGGMMGGIGGALTGYSMGGFIGQGVQHIASSMMEGAHEQSAVERTLSQFQFQNGASRTGKGFTRSDSMQIGNMVREMERVPEMLTSFGELNRVMDKMGQMGLMQGVKDAGEFMRKFKDTTHVLKDMAKMMGTTMEGALQTFGEARQSGFYSKTDITKNVLSRQMTGAVTGMSQDQVGGMQMYGAEMAHSLGGSRAGGAKNMLRTMGQLGAANQMGILSNDQIMEMTGKEGAEGIQELSGQMGQLSYKMGRSNVGQALTLALGKQKDGRYTGEMDEELVAKVRSGELSLSELKSMARSKAGTRGAKLSFAAHKDRLRTEMAGAVGSEGISMQLQEILGEKGWQNPDAQNLVMQRFGASEEQANLLQQMMPKLQGIGSEMALAGKNQMRNTAMNTAMAEQGWDAIKHRIGKKISHYTTDWAKDLGVGVRDYFQNFADDFLDDLGGRYTSYVTKRVSDTVKFGGSSLRSMTQNAGSLNSSLGATRMDVGASGGLTGMLARGAHSLGGGISQGENIDYVMGHAMGGKFLQHAGTGGGLGGFLTDQASGAIGRGTAATRMGDRSGAVVLDSTTSGRVSFTTQDKYDALRKSISSGDYGDDQLKTLQSVGSAGDIKGLVDAYKKAMSDGDVTQETDQTKRAKLIYSKLREQNRSGMSNEAILNEQYGGKVTSVLGKAKGKGLQDLDIVAAIQKASGGGYRGGVDFGDMLGEFNSTNQKGVSDKLKGLDQKFQGMGGTNSANWSDLKKMMDDGGQMGSLAAGLLHETGAKYLPASFSDRSVTDALAKDPKSWKPEDRKALQSKGIDPDKLAAKMGTPEGAAEVDRLMKLVSSGKITESDVRGYLTLKDASGLNEVASRFRSRGSEMEKRLGGGAAEILGRTKEGQEVLRLMHQQATDLQKVKSGSGDFHDDGAISAAIDKLKDPEARAAAQSIGGVEQGAVSSYRKQLMGRGGLGGAMGKGTQGVLAAAGLGDIGYEGAEGDFRKKIEGALGKNKTLDAGELEKIVKMLVDVKSKGLSTTPGATAGSTQTSEADIAKSLATMSENTKTTAQLLADLATGAALGSHAAGGASK